MSILRSLPKIKETRGNAKTKNISCDVDLTNGDLQNEDYSFTQLSNSETGLRVLDHGSTKEAEGNVSNKRGKYIKYSGTKLESMPPSTAQQARYKKTKANFISLTRVQ